MLRVASVLAFVAVAASACVHDCDAHGADDGYRLPDHHPWRRLNGNGTAAGRVDAHPPFRLFQALSSRYEIAEPHAGEIIEVKAFTRAEPSGEEATDEGTDEGTGEDDEPREDRDEPFNFVAVRPRKPVPECTPRPKRASRTPVPAAADDAKTESEALSDQVSAESPPAAASASSLDSGASTSGSSSTASTAGETSAASSSSEPAAGQASATSNATTDVSGSIRAPTSTTSALKPTAVSTPVPPASNGSSPTLGNSSSSSPGGLNSTGVQQPGDSSSSVNAGDGSRPQAAVANSSSTQPAVVQACVPISVEGDATYCVPPNDPKLGTLSCSGAAVSTSAVKLSNRICPRKGDTAIHACQQSLRSFNTTTNSCVAPEDSVCIVIHTGVWGCSFSFSPSSIDVKTPSSNLQTASSSAAVATSFSAGAGSDHENGSIAPGYVLVIAGAVAFVLAVLAIAKRKRQSSRDIGDHDAAARGHETYFSYPKTPELSKASESIHSFT